MRIKTKRTEKSIILLLALGLTLCSAKVCEVATISTAFNHTSTDSNSFTTLRETADPLPQPILTQNSVELCLNSRYSDHGLTGTASAQQLSNVVWGAGRAPVTGAYRDIYVATRTETYLYDANDHSLSSYSGDVTLTGAFSIYYNSELAFDAGLSYMPAILASVSLRDSNESQVASCPKQNELYFGVQATNGLTSELVAQSSVPEGEPGWLPDPSTTGENSLEAVLANLNYVDSFVQTNLTLHQISQILWAGYGCTPHTAYNGRKGLTVPSASAEYYLTRKIYLVNENGVYRYHNRNPSTDLTTRDHRIEQISSVDVRGSLQSAVSDLPQAPCYVILCPNSFKYANLEMGFVASNMLIQASAIDLGCHFKTELTSGEQGSIQTVTSIPSSHIPQTVVSIGGIATVDISVVLQGHGRPDSGWVVPLSIKLFAPGADVLNDTPIYEFNLTTTKSSTLNTAVCQATGVAPSTYDVTAVSEHTLMNVKRSVVISAPSTSVDMGTLLEGNANNDDIVNLKDLAILSMCWLVSEVQAEYDARADFDRNGFISMDDLYLMTANWLRTSPVEVPPTNVDISVVLQGHDRPDSGWVVPLSIKLFAPGADVLNDTPIYEFNLTTTKSSTLNTAVCQVTGIAPGTYDVTVVSEHTLINIKRSMVISAPSTSVDMGTLLEGNANNDDIVNLKDLAILSMYWLVSEVQAEYDARADFDRNGFINMDDLYLLTANWLRTCPVEVP